MKLIFLYGSPAVGKLTVAREIAARTGYRLFHNHLTIDAVRPVFDYGSESFGKLVDLFRVEAIREAARKNVDLIYTFCYAKDADDPHVERILEAVEENGGEVCFVLLKADRSALDRRVVQKSRVKLGKAQSVEMIDFFHRTYDLLSPVPFRESLVIDNTRLSARKAARQIIRHFNLRESKTEPGDQQQ